MKKRQKPYLLLTLLVIAGGGVAFVAKLANNGQNPQADQPALSQPQDAKETPQGVGHTVAGMVKGAKATPPMAPKMPMPKNGRMDEPTIKKFKPTAYKPVPNDSSVSSQWYTPESMNGNK